MANSKKTKAGPYSANFQQALIEGGILPAGYEDRDGKKMPKPDNLEEIHLRLKLPRPSLPTSPSLTGVFEEVGEADDQTRNEQEVKTLMIPLIEGKVSNRRSVARSISFTNMAELNNTYLTKAKPDLYCGTPPEDLDQAIRDELEHHILPSTRKDLPMAPNFFLEVKGPRRMPDEVRVQACYDGTLGARAMQQLQSYGQDELVFDNKAYTISSTYQDGQLKMYTTHPVAPREPGGQPRYSTTRIGTWGMSGDAEIFQQGATAFRNARDWTQEQRDRFVAAANQRRANEGQAGDQAPSHDGTGA